MLKLFDALPAYFGGKRKLAKKILNYAEGKIFIDAFMGGGSVALLAKARGFKVIANDIADRSEIVGRALIVNEDVFIEEEDIIRLFEDNQGNKHFIRDHFPEQYKPEMADFLDNARANIDEIKDFTKQSVMLLLWIHLLLYYRPMSAFSHVGAVDQIDKPTDDKDVINRLRERYSRPIYDVVKRLAEFINSGIFTNGLDNEIHKTDVFEFLPATKGDAVYLDPPYFGAASYEYHYKVLDSMLLGQPVQPQHSVFNTKQVFTQTGRLFESCRHIPTCILSVGQRIIDKQRYVDLMSEFWPVVEDIPIQHTHAYAYGLNEESGKQEVLLVGRS